jgi:hypothetical protein
MINFTLRNIGFTHHDLEMIDERFHVVIYILLWRKIEIGNVGREVRAFR